MMSENNAKTQTVSENTNLRLDSNRQGNNYQLSVQVGGPVPGFLVPVRDSEFFLAQGIWSPNFGLALARQSDEP